MKVISSEGGATLWTLAEARVVATADALGAEDMEALGKNRVLLTSAAAGAVQLGLWGEVMTSAPPPLLLTL